MDLNQLALNLAAAKKNLALTNLAVNEAHTPWSRAVAARGITGVAAILSGKNIQTLDIRRGAEGDLNQICEKLVSAIIANNTAVEKYKAALGEYNEALKRLGI